MEPVVQTKGLFVFERATNNDPLIVGINLLSNRGSSTEATDGSLMVVNFEPGTVLKMPWTTLIPSQSVVMVVRVQDKAVCR